MQHPSCLFSLIPVVQFYVHFHVQCRSQPIPTRGFLAVALTPPSLHSRGGNFPGFNFLARSFLSPSPGGGVQQATLPLFLFATGKVQVPTESGGGPQRPFSFPQVAHFCSSQGCRVRCPSPELCPKNAFFCALSGTFGRLVRGHPGRYWRLVRTQKFLSFLPATCQA